MKMSKGREEEKRAAKKIGVQDRDGQTEDN